jgi:hypothetical protein
MAIQQTKDDPYIRERAKWEMRPVEINGAFVQPIPFADGGRGGAPHAEYPKVLYRAEAAYGGPRICEETRLVHDDGQERIAIGQGWHVDQREAIAAVHAAHLEHARLAANRAAHERGMSDNARAEAAAVDEATMEHVPSIPETPIRRRVAKE